MLSRVAPVVGVGRDRGRGGRKGSGWWVETGVWLGGGVCSVVGSKDSCEVE